MNTLGIPHIRCFAALVVAVLDSVNVVASASLLVSIFRVSARLVASFLDVAMLDCPLLWNIFGALKDDLSLPLVLPTGLPDDEMPSASSIWIEPKEVARPWTCFSDTGKSRSSGADSFSETTKSGGLESQELSSPSVLHPGQFHGKMSPVFFLLYILQAK